jgi:hypothetical protein
MVFDSTAPPITLVGIDPSLVNCAAAVLTDGGALDMKTGDWQEVIAFLRSKGMGKKDGRQWLVVLEHPGLDKPSFGMADWIVSEAYRGGSNRGELRSIASRALKISQDAGESRAAAKVLHQIFQSAGVPVYLIAPSTRDRADKYKKKHIGVGNIKMLSMPTKTTAAQFEELTGLRIRCSEHARDAATLIWGRSQKWAQGRILAIQSEKPPTLF